MLHYQCFLQENDVNICTNVYLNDTSSTAVIIFAGLNLSKSGPFFLLSRIAQKCAKAGLNVFQFDYYGEGDSSGDYKNVSIDKIFKSIDLVKTYVKQCGCQKYVYIGYGIGNLLISKLAYDKELIGVCLIGPEFAEYKSFNYIYKYAQSNQEYIYEQDYIWPAIYDSKSKKYWESIIGIAHWLYYTPINMLFLKDLAKLDCTNIFMNDDIDVLIIEDSDSLTDNYKLNWQICALKGMRPNSKCEWEVGSVWPDLWDNIIINIEKWICCFPHNNPKNEIDLTKIKISSDEYKDKNIKRISCAFNSNGNKLFGILHIPQDMQSTNNKLSCIIYEPGLGGSRVDMCRAGVWLGDEAAKKKYAFFRYDSQGSGVSEGDFSCMTWEDRLHNLEDAIDFLLGLEFIDVSKIFIVTYSAGSKVACLVSKKETMKGYVLWSPHFFDDDFQKK